MASPGPVFLHVGAPKTGTTYVQTVLDAARAALAHQGVLVPGSKLAQQRATRDLLAVGTQRSRQSRRGVWRRTLQRMQDWPGTVVFSNETLVLGLQQPRIARIQDRLGDRELHVVYTARDLVRALPASWQESLKNRSTATFAAYVDALRSGVPLRTADPGERLWLAQDICAAMHRWQAVVGPERVHVVTLPPPGAPRDLLLARFGATIGADLTPFAGAPTEPNVSLDAAEAAVLRRLNELLADADPPLPFPDYVRWVKRLLANEVLPTRAGRGRLWLTPDQAAWALAESHRVADAVAESGFDVVGDLDDLRPNAPWVPVHEGDVDAPSVDTERDVALLALASVLPRAAVGSPRSVPPIQ
jgi:hypothetical protein